MADKKKYRFVEKVQSRDGKLATALAGASALLFVLVVIISFAAGGKAESFVGGLALTAALLSVYGFYVGMRSFSEKNVSSKFSLIGSILSGIIMIGWLTLFLVGLG